MTRSAAEIRDNPASTGDCNWVDVVNNWRDADATWLQERSIIRVNTTPDAEGPLANTNEGRVFYSIANQKLYISTTGGAPFATVFSSRTLLIDEATMGFVTLGINGHESAGITFDTSSGAVTIGNLSLYNISVSSVTATTALIQTLAVGTAFSLITDGTHTVHLTTGAAGLITDTGLSVGGTLQAPTATLGTVTVTTGTFTTVTVGGTLTANAVVTPTVQAPGASDFTLPVQSGKAVRFTAPTIGDANFFYGAGANVRMAWVVVSATDPGVATVPEGTIWVQTDLP